MYVYVGNGKERKNKANSKPDRPRVHYMYVGESDNT